MKRLQIFFTSPFQLLHQSMVFSYDKSVASPTARFKLAVALLACNKPSRGTWWNLQQGVVNQASFDPIYVSLQ